VRGLEGVQRSTELYRALFDDLAFEVVDQVAEDDRVASRWVLTGSNRGRDVRFWGITLSHLRDGRIVEDWSASCAHCWRRRACSARCATHAAADFPPGRSVAEDGGWFVADPVP
jgi:ketosteroid isomerase-like protein